MKIRSHMRAGNQADDLRRCQQERDYWKSQADFLEALVNSPTPPLPKPAPAPIPVVATCGWINGVYYADRSGTCG